MQDAELLFSSAQVLDSTANTGSTNEIDLGSTGMGEGQAVKLVVNVTALTGTLAIKVASKTSASVAVTDNVLIGPAVASGITGQYHFTLPQNINRFVKVFYTAGTSATVTAWLTAAPL